MAQPGTSGILQLLTFNLDKEVYGFDIARVREVMEFRTATPVPKSPNFMKGVINLRGRVIPVIDLKIKCGLKPTEITDDTCVIIVEVKHAKETVVMGAIADQVQEVLEFSREKMESLPKIGTRLNPEYAKTMGRHQDGYFIVLDVDKIFYDVDMESMDMEGNAA